MSSRFKPDPASVARLCDFALNVVGREGPLSPPEDEHLRAELAQMELQPTGSELIAEDQRLDVPFLLLDGWAMRQRVLSDGRRQIFGFVLPGDPIGLCGLDDPRAFCATIALTDVTIAPVPVLAVALREKNLGALGRWGHAMISLEERALYDQVVRLGQQSAYERLSHQLLNFYYRLRVAGLIESSSFTMPFSQEVLSDALGLSVVHTNRTMQQLRREQLIETQGQQVRLLDPIRLAGICDYHPPRRLKWPVEW